jgi:hypothetical protein
MRAPTEGRGSFYSAMIDDLEVTITELKQALVAINVRLDEIERRADREEGALLAAIGDLQRELGKRGVHRIEKQRLGRPWARGL